QGSRTHLRVGRVLSPDVTLVPQVDRIPDQRCGRRDRDLTFDPAEVVGHRDRPRPAGEIDRLRGMEEGPVVRAVRAFDSWWEDELPDSRLHDAVQAVALSCLSLRQRIGRKLQKVTWVSQEGTDLIRKFVVSNCK